MAAQLIPLFPLHAVLFPEGALALRIFEPRYLDMIGDCLRNDCGIGFCLIKEGEEVGRAALPFEVGTLAHITYWHKRDDGLLGVTVRGAQRFRLIRAEAQPDELLLGDIQLIPNEPQIPLPPRFAPLAELLQRILDELDFPYRNLVRRYDDASWVSARLTELLPIPLEQKQYFLQLDDPIERLERLAGAAEVGL